VTGERFALATILLCPLALGQQTIGHVTLRDAAVSGPLEVSDGRATLQGGASIVARDHTAELSLDRGGVVNICATSSLHVTSGAQGAGTESTPLLFALDRGAIELRTVAGARDVVITPDLRFSTPTGGPVDLRIRVTSNGDTCVENRGVRAPTIEAVEQFGEGRYLIPAGQHVLFEHGSVREVVDRESSPCGCPPAPVVSVAESGSTANVSEAARAGGQAAAKKEEHPFPVAQSQGLAPAATPNAAQVPAGQVHAQVAATMAYGAGADSTAAPAAAAVSPSVTAAAPKTDSAANQPIPMKSAAAAPTPAVAVPQPAAAQPEVPPAAAPASVSVKAPPPPAPPGAHDIAHRIGHFFKRIFGGG